MRCARACVGVCEGCERDTPVFSLLCTVESNKSAHLFSFLCSVPTSHAEISQRRTA